MKQFFAVHAAVLGVAILFGCTSPENGGMAPGEEPGRLHLRLEGGDAVSSVMANIAIQNVMLRSETYLVECAAKDHELNGSPFCDELIVLPPGVYQIVVQPTDPSCSSEYDHYKVLVNPDRTTEIMVNLVCGGESGGLDVIVVTKYRPAVTAISFEFEGGGTANKFICQGSCEHDVLVEVQVNDADSTCAELTATWKAVDAAGVDVTNLLLVQRPPGEAAGVCLFSVLVDSAAPLGSYTITLSVVDEDGYKASFAFPVHLIDCGDEVFHWNEATASGQYAGSSYTDTDLAYLHTDSSIPPTGGEVLPGESPIGSMSYVIGASNSTIVGGVDLGDLPLFLFHFADGRTDGNWQGATKGFVGDVTLDGVQLDERTSGSVPYAGTMYTNDVTLGAWQAIVDQNSVGWPTPQAFASTGATTLVSNLTGDLVGAFQSINALPASAGFESRASTSLNGLNTQNGVNQTIVINVTSGLSFTSKINITGDAGDVYVLRWDTDGIPTNGYQGQVKPASGGAIVPLGGLKPTNFINVAGDINASGGGTNPLPPYPQGPRYDDGQGDLIVNGANFAGGGFFTGYWLTTGSPDILDPVSGLWYGETSPLSNGIIVGGWYTITTKFSMTSGTSGVYVSANPPSTGEPAIDVEKYVAVDAALTWQDADAAPGPTLISPRNPEFKFVVTNTGNVTLTNLTLVDTVYGSITLPVTSLGPGASTEVFLTGTFAAGQHTNNAVVTGTSNGTTVQDEDPANYVGATGAIDLEKYVSGDGGANWHDADFPTGPVFPAGSPISFKFVVTNTGTLPLNNVTVTDDVFGLILSMPLPLAPGASHEFTLAGTWMAGQHANTATVTGTDNGNTYSDTDMAHYFGPAAPGILVEKYVSVDGGLSWHDADTYPGEYIEPGTLPMYQFVVTNIGETPLENVTVTDSVLGSIGTVPMLMPGDSWMWTVTGSALGVCI